MVNYRWTNLTKASGCSRKDYTSNSSNQSYSHQAKFAYSRNQPSVPSNSIGTSEGAFAVSEGVATAWAKATTGSRLTYIHVYSTVTHSKTNNKLPSTICLPLSNFIIPWPSKYDAYNVKFGSLSSVEAFFATLPDLLQDPMAQKEFELDALDDLLQHVSSNNTSLTYHAFIASKSDPDTLIYHEAMISTDKQEFCKAMENEINKLEK